MRILIDVNVFMDVLDQRAGAVSSASVLTLAETGTLEGYVSALTPIVVYYLRLRAGMTEAESRTAAEEVFVDLTVVPVDRDVLVQAIHSTMPDFEDNVQAYCAAACQADYIVTRNVSDFVGSPVPAITPDDLLALVLPATP
jgi:predicted nucleic acid-binding protein